MSLLDRLADSLQNYAREQKRDRHPYLTRESVGFSEKWVLKKGADGCRPVQAQAAISMDKNPPPLPGEKPASAPAAPPPTGGQHVAPAKQAIPAPGQQGAAAPQAQPASAPRKADDCPQPPPFDMLDLPEGMQAQGFKYAAYCARRWFNGKAHVIPDKFGGIVDPAFVDTDTFKLSWILGFGDVRKRYEHLLSDSLGPSAEENIFNEKAKRKIKEKIQHFMTRHDNYYSGVLDTLAECNKDKQVLHQQFQFQLADVSMLDVTGGVLKSVADRLAMNDLGASLANFNIYAAVASVKIFSDKYNRYDLPWKHCTIGRAEVTHVYVYAKDVYSFNDSSENSQYLGHWNRRGVIIVLDGAIADFISSNSFSKEKFELANSPRKYLPPLSDALDGPVDVKSNLRKTEVYFPVRNRDFNRWREIKRRGGDLLIYSDFIKIKLVKPIFLEIDEVCKGLK